MKVVVYDVKTFTNNIGERLKTFYMRRIFSNKQVLFSVGIGLIFASCSSLSTIPIEVMQPASYSVPPNIISVLVVDNSYPSISDSANRVDLLGKESVIDSVSVTDFGLRAAESMAFSLNERAFFDSVFVHPVSFNRPKNGIPVPDLTLESIDSLLSIYNANAIIALEDFRYNSLIKVVEHPESYYVTLDAAGSIFWKFYDADGYILDTYLQPDSIFWDNVVPKHHNAPIVIPELRDALETLADFMGSNYPNRVAPSWKSEQRFFFISGHHLFARATDLAKVNNWGEAAKVWYYVYENGNLKQKAMAAFNLALSFEMRGDFSEAMAWAEISHNQFEALSSWRASSYIKNNSLLYYLRLKERLDEKSKLHEQLGSSS